MTHWSRFDATADRRLLKKLADGDESALTEVYDIYAERLYDYALLFTSDVHTARGIVHDALIDAARRSARMRDRRQLRPWLYAAIRRRGMARRRDAWSPPKAPAGDDTLRLAHAALSALDRTHRDALCLALRHDFDGAALATTIGVTQRRARHRVERAISRAETAAAAAGAGDGGAGNGGAGGGSAGDRGAGDRGAGDEPAGGGAGTGDERAGDDPAGEGGPGEGEPLTAVDLMRAFPAVPPPEALRDRVLHTSADPQLARYRSQIVSRGGRLIASGLPRQPDAPSQVARRYAVGSASLAGFLAVVAVGLNIIGGVSNVPDIGRPAPSWRTSPAHPTADPSETSGHDPGPGDQPIGLPTGHSGHNGTGAHPHDPSSAHPTDHGTPGPHASASGSVPPGRGQPSSPPLPGSGALAVRPGAIGLGGNKNAADITLTAKNGPVTWTASSGSPAVTLSDSSGTIDPGRTARVTVHLARNSLVQLPGKATVTVSGGGGAYTVPVSWSISLLSR